MTLTIQKIQQFEGHEGAIYSLQYNKSLNKIYSAGFDDIIVEWDLDDPKNFKAIAKLQTKTISLLYVPELNWLITGQSDGGVHIIDLNQKKEIHYLKVHQDMIFALCFRIESNTLYIGSGDGNISMWQIKGMNLLKKVDLKSKKIRTIQTVNDVLHIGCGDGTIKLLDYSSLDLKHTILGHRADFSVNTISFTPNKKHMISGSRDGHLNIYNLEKDIELEKRIPAHNFAIYDIVFSPDKQFYASASRDKSIKIWDAQTFKFIMKIDFSSHKGHTASVNSILWVNDRLITTGDDRKIIVWTVDI